MQYPRLRFLFLAGLLLLFSLPASACDFWLSVGFGAGPKRCLTDFAVGKAVSPEIGRSVIEAVPRVGAYVVAAPLSETPMACPAVVGMWRYDTSNGTTATALPPLDRRVSEAVARCESAMRGQGAAGCKCQPVLVDGSTHLSEAAFASLGSGAQVATAPLPAPAPAPARPALAEARTPAPAAVPAPTTQAARPADTSNAQLQAELAEMRSKLAALERGRAASPPQRAQAAVPRVTARALVIGNGTYTSFGRLPNPKNDATAMAAKLRSFGIEVDLVVDADRDTLIRALSSYSSKAAGSDVNILFYAGHGVQVDGVNYIIPTNMRADNITAGYVKLSGIALNATLDYLPARTRLVFLDACRDNPVSRSLGGTRSGGATGLAPVAAASGTMIAYATRDGATAEDGAGAHSPYTAALLAHLDAPQDISLVLRQVRQTVMRSTSGRQEPWEYGSLVGDQLVLSQMARP